MQCLFGVCDGCLPFREAKQIQSVTTGCVDKEGSNVLNITERR